MGFWIWTTARSPSRDVQRRLRRFTVPAWREPIGSRTTISPAISSTGSSSERIPASPIRWYSSTVNRRRLSVTAMSILKAGCEALSTPQLRYTAFDLEGRLMSFVSHVECTVCGHRHDPKRPLTVCEACGQMLAARYDLERVKASVSKDALRQRPPGMYRFRELTPLDAGEVPVTLGEGGTPLLALPRLAAHLGMRRLWAKDEGQKTIGLELAADLDWRMPDVLLYPTGGGTGLLGIPKGYEELRAMGWLAGALPRVFAVQADGCAPVVKAFQEGAPTTTAWEDPTTHAAGLRVPSPFAGRQMLRVLRETGGGAVAVSETAIQEAQQRVARLEGIWTAPESAALVAALTVLREGGEVAGDTEGAMIFTGAGLKYEPPPLAPPVDLAGSDAEVLAELKRAIRP